MARSEFLANCHRFCLVSPVKSDEWSPIAEALAIVEVTATEILAPSVAQKVLSSEPNGLLRQMRRALKHGDTAQFTSIVAFYNKILFETTIPAEKLISVHSAPYGLVREILSQTYQRIVGPEIESLRAYTAFSSNVYGELLPKFVSQLFKEAGMSSADVFVDLGSGVGNCVLQAALEIGCESWGCEIMAKASQLADLQKAEFCQRMQQWSFNYGAINLVHSDFLESPLIAKILTRVSVVLVNNYAFEPELNDALARLFLDLPQGCIIFSLKSFVPDNFVLSERNFHSPASLLTVRKKEFGSGCVSWTGTGGVYYMSLIDRQRVARWIDKRRGSPSV